MVNFRLSLLFYDLAYAYLFDEKKSESESPAKQKQIEDGVNESFLVCDINEYDFKDLSSDNGYATKRNSYKCKNPYSQGSTHMFATPYVGFVLENFGKINISISEYKIRYLDRKFFDKKKGKRVSYEKDIFQSRRNIYKISAILSNDKYWIVENRDANSMISIGKPGTKPEVKISTILTPEQLTYLASDDVWELPDFLKQ